jgi:hypothetical protein
MVADRSIDFLFSFDSIVHADADVFQDYPRQLGRKLNVQCPALAVPRQSSNRQPAEDHGDADEDSG